MRAIDIFFQPISGIYLISMIFEIFSKDVYDGKKVRDQSENYRCQGRKRVFKMEMEMKLPQT